MTQIGSLRHGCNESVTFGPVCPRNKTELLSLAFSLAIIALAFDFFPLSVSSNGAAPYEHNSLIEKIELGSSASDPKSISPSTKVRSFLPLARNRGLCPLNLFGSMAQIPCRPGTLSSLGLRLTQFVLASSSFIFMISVPEFFGYTVFRYWKFSWCLSIFVRNGEELVLNFCSYFWLLCKVPDVGDVAANWLECRACGKWCTCPQESEGSAEYSSFDYDCCWRLGQFFYTIFLLYFFFFFQLNV